jgi:hypothetical protein
MESKKEPALCSIEIQKYRYREARKPHTEAQQPKSKEEKANRGRGANRRQRRQRGVKKSVDLGALRAREQERRQKR